jgi:RimJ/RimL family protein N-acetyltransferase
MVSAIQSVQPRIPGNGQGCYAGEDLKSETNEFGQLVGLPAKIHVMPTLLPMLGRFCCVQPLEIANHVSDLFEAFSADDGRMWTYLPWGPFRTAQTLGLMLEWTSHAIDTPLQWYAIVNNDTEKADGLVAYLRSDNQHGVVEIVGVTFSPRLQKTSIATEALYLMKRRAFEELGYRRCEWRADALNSASRAAALRLGFKFEGTFRQATVYKGRNRDTACYSIIDSEWPDLAASYVRWLAPSNFDKSGQQRVALSALTLAR